MTSPSGDVAGMPGSNGDSEGSGDMGIMGLSITIAAGRNRLYGGEERRGGEEEEDDDEE
jgi:hypothetical protein